MALSSQGIGSGLDVNSIVSQLVAIEKQPLQALQTKAATLQSQVSLYGTVKSQASTLGDTSAILASASNWNVQKASSANATAVGVTLGTTSTATSFSVQVQQLASTQTAASAGVTAGDPVGSAGTLTIQLGNWTGASSALGFSAAASASVAVSIIATDTTTTIASKINAANAGVTATVLRDGANERLVLRSSTSGESGGFSVTAAGGGGLAQFEVTGTIDSTNSTPAAGMFMSQVAQNAQVKINGVSVSSASNKMSEVVPGVTLQLSQVTAAPVEITIENDLTAIQKNIQNFVDAYNAMSQTLTSATKYDASTKIGGPLQGDATTLGLQSALRSILGSGSTGSTYSRLSDVGLERQTDGTLKVNATKLTAALGDLDNLKTLFTKNNNDVATNGFGLKLRDFARGLVAFDGRVSNKTTALQGAISRNTKDQSGVNERATRVEADLRRQYGALDTQMAKWNGLSSYVNAQLAQWNKTS